VSTARPPPRSTDASWPSSATAGSARGTSSPPRKTNSEARDSPAPNWRRWKTLPPRPRRDRSDL